MEPRTGMSRRRSVGPTQDPQPGATFGGRYTIVRLIARGGVGLVYLARKAVSHDPVVVKVLAANLVGDAEATARFDREARRLRGIQHPNIVAMVDYGHADGSAYLVMEYLEGELLSAFAARRGPLSLAEFTPIAAQILKAVGFAHTQGLMHRDLKPSNIMLCTRKGRGNFVKILDFGMAKLIEGEREITAEQIVGTANYLSPEQIRGEPIDARVDVYAIGVMFYALLSGRFPFAAEHDSALLYKHVHEEPPPLARVLPPGHGVPPGLVALVHRCLAKDVDDRPADANAVAAALLTCVPGELFHLPHAEGDRASASSSYALLPPALETGPDDFSDRLTRPVQSLRAARAAPSTHRTGSHPPVTGSTGRPRTRNRLPPIRPATIPPTSTVAPTIASPPAEGARVWLVIAGAVVLALLGLGGYLLSNAGRAPAEASAPGLDERRLGARLDQIELDLHGGDFERARSSLADIDRSLAAALAALDPEAAATPASKTLTGLRTRADVLRRKLDVADTIARAQRLEKIGQTAEALSSYRDALALDPTHVEAHAALARLSAPSPTPTRPGRARETRSGPRPAARPPEAAAAGTPADPAGGSTPPSSPADGAGEPATPNKPADGDPRPAAPGQATAPAPNPPADDGLLGDAREADPFLPVGE